MVVIVGGGPAGSYLGYLLAKKGKEVFIVEEHKEIGKPVHCTGLVTSSILDIIQIPESLIINKIRKARIHSSKDVFIDVKIDENLVLDRAGFDKYLFDSAIKAGATPRLNEKFIGFQKEKKNLVVKTSKGEIRSDFLVGCDGALSKIGQITNLTTKRKFFIGVEYIMKSRFDKETIFFWMMDKGFGWVVPESGNVARVGIVTRKNPNAEFEKFLSFIFDNKTAIVLEKRGGIIPIFNYKEKRCAKRVLLCGDAGGFVKATSAGGIIQALISAKCASESILKNEDYENLLKKQLKKELWLHLLIRKVLDKMNQKDRDCLIKLFSQKKLKILLNTIDRDHMSYLLVRCLLSEPRLLFFAKFLL